MSLVSWTVALALSQAPPAADAGAGLLDPPTRDGRPVEVAVSLHLIDFARVTPREESFDVTGYLELRWTDPRRVGRPGPLDPRREWTPRFWFENALEQPRYHGEPEIAAEPDGSITSWAIFSAKLSAPMDLRLFPFDAQSLPVRIGAFDDLSRVVFRAGEHMAQLDRDAFVSDWAIGEPSDHAETRTFVDGGEAYARYVATVPIRRRSTFYVWRVMVPLTLLALVAWASFWFEPVGLQPQISTCTAALIALVAFNFAVDFSLPKVMYLTVIDTHALLGYAFVAAAIAVVTMVHRAVVHGRIPLALTIQRVARWTFLPAYVALALANLWLPPYWRGGAP